MNITNIGGAYEELCRERAKRTEDVSTSDTDTRPQNTAQSTQKEQYLRSKQEAAEARRAKNRLDRLQKEAEKLENELEEVETEMNGDAAYDYVRLSELDKRRNEIEERLLEIYEEI